MNIVFHIPQPISKDPASGSDYRPSKMLDSFRQISVVHEVTGNQKERHLSIRVIRRRILNGEKIDFVYSESTTMPTALSDRNHIPLRPLMDFRFLKFCKTQGIPVMLFYRDIHWRFPQRTKVSWIKRSLALPFYYFDLFQYSKIVDVLYLPSLNMLKHIPVKMRMVVKSLPPGSNESQTIQLIPASDKSKVNLGYIGGLGELYNIKSLVSIVSSLPDFASLKINTREKDWEENKHFYTGLLNDNISVSHLKSNEINKLYNGLDILMIYIQPSEYWKFVMPVKLFEAISFLKPVIATKGTAVAEFITQNNIGWEVPYSETHLRDFLMNLSKADILEKMANLKEVRKKNLWLTRVEQVKNDRQNI